MERCSCCNARLKSALRCPRCGTDFTMMAAAERSAQRWLCTAIQYWLQNETELGLAASKRSLRLKHTPLVRALTDCLIDLQCKEILDLLMQERILEAKKRLYRLQPFFTDNELLWQLNAFTDYQLTKRYSDRIAPVENDFQNE